MFWWVHRLQDVKLSTQTEFWCLSQVPSSHKLGTVIYSDIEDGLANGKLTNPQYAQLKCSHVGSSFLGRRKDEEELIYPSNKLGGAILSITNAVLKNNYYLPYLCDKIGFKFIGNKKAPGPSVSKT